MAWFALTPCPRRRSRLPHKSLPLTRRLVVVFACCCALVNVPLLGAEEATDQQDYDLDDIHVTTEKDNATDGRFLGSVCEDSCDAGLPHVFCDRVTRHCECDKMYPVKLGPTRGCAKPVRLGDQCFYGATCTFTDVNAACVQIHHNAICQCKPGYHSVAVARPTKRIFCSEDLVLLTTDLPTLFGVATGIALFTALICFVLKLFSSARYTRPRHYANANLAPPILFSSDLGIPLAVHRQGGRPSSRASQRSCATVASGYSRRASSGGSRGILVPASRAGAARAAAILLISCHLTTTNNTNDITQLDNDDEQSSNCPVAGKPPCR